ncbi:MAG TPA: ABC transporter permease [Gaiellaceae bacterium]|nr:ABC transporter permease [Gaiellaceae bacterium]
MTDEDRQDLEQEIPPQVAGGDYAPSVAARMALWQRAGGVVLPLVTTIFAFLMGMIVIAATGHNPFTAFRGIFNGTGLNWFFPWVLGQDRSDAAFNLQQTLILTATLILTGLAVSFAFKCGLFNIGGQGQYIVGAAVATWVGSSWGHTVSGELGPEQASSFSPVLHIAIAVALASVAGALWAAIAGFLKATVGAHEVITTIMLNWIAIYVAQYLFGRGGPLQNTVDQSIPISSDVITDTRLPVFWGDPDLQGLHVGLFIALAMPVVFWIILNRTTLGYEVRATGFNPDAARYGGISVRKSYVSAMAISGFFAGLAGAIDILGWQYRLGVLDIQVSNIGFIGIAVALLGRNSAIGIPLGALLFGALVQGTSTRNPAIQDVFPPELAGNLTLIIQGLVLLFVGADLLFIYLWQARKKLPLRTQAAPAREQA